MPPSAITATIAPDELYALVARLLGQGAATVDVRASGRSMEPFIRHGDNVTLAPPAAVTRGDIVLARTDRGVMLHAVTAIAPDGTITLMGTSNLVLTETCTPADVAGRVTAIRGKPSASARRRRAVRAWNALRPLRRPLIYIYRLIYPCLL